MYRSLRSTLLLGSALGLATLLGAAPAPAQSATQLVISVQSKAPAALTPANLSLEVEGHATPLTSLVPLAPESTQVVLLIDDGLRTSLGRQLSDIEQFLKNLKPGTEVMVGYMQNGRVVSGQGFTTDHAAAASALRLPFGSPGLSASPYLCLSDFAKHWPKETEAYGSAREEATGRKHRLVLMLTNGVDPYNGSVSPLNQNSPYVQTAIDDAQRAGVSVYSIYYGDAGIRGGAANFSGQSYLQQVAQATGGDSFYNMRGNPVALAPYLQQFLDAINSSYVATFNAPEGNGNRGLLSVRIRTHGKGLKLRAANAVHPGSGGPATGE